MLALSRSTIDPCTPPPRANRATLPYDLMAGLPITPDDPDERGYAQLEAGAPASHTPLQTLLPARPILSPVLRSAQRARRKTREPIAPTSPLLKSPAIVNLGIFTAIAQAEEEEDRQHFSPYTCDSMPTPELGFFSPASTYATSCTSLASPASCFTSPPQSFDNASPFLESAFEDLYMADRYAEELKTKQNITSPLLEAHNIHSALGLFVSPVEAERQASPTLSSASAGLKLSLYLSSESSPPESFNAQFPGRPLTTSICLLPSMLSDDGVSTVNDLKREIISKLGLQHIHVSDSDVGLYLSNPASPELVQAMDEGQLKSWGLDQECEEASIVAVISTKAA